MFATEASGARLPEADEGCLQILFAAPGHRASAFSDMTLDLTSNIPERVHRQVQRLIRCPLCVDPFKHALMIANTPLPALQTPQP